VDLVQRLRGAFRSAQQLRHEVRWTLRTPLPRRTKLAIAAAQIRGTLSRRPKYFRVPYGSSTLLLGNQTLAIDVATIRGVLAGEYFESDFAAEW
jgi:hypothetical protein